jgi:hypothetical protein
VPRVPGRVVEVGEGRRGFGGGDVVGRDPFGQRVRIGRIGLRGGLVVGLAVQLRDGDERGVVGVREGLGLAPVGDGELLPPVERCGELAEQPLTPLVRPGGGGRAVEPGGGAGPPGERAELLDRVRVGLEVAADGGASGSGGADAGARAPW